MLKIFLGVRKGTSTKLQLGGETLYIQVNKMFKEEMFKEENKSDEVLCRCVSLGPLGSRHCYGRQKCKRFTGSNVCEN